MKAVVYNGPRDIVVKNMPDAQIAYPTDVLVRITSTNICGSDLHMYEGRTSLEKGRIIGHENLGEVIEVGSAVRRIQVGDRVCVPFNCSCGYCKNCERGLTSACLTMNPGHAGAGYGYAEMGPYQGGQAEYLVVPYGDFIPQKYVGTVRGQPVCEFRQHFNPIIQKITLDFSLDTANLLDRRLGLAAAILLSAIEERQDGGGFSVGG